MRKLLTDAGFSDVAIDIKSQSKDIISAWMPGSNAEDFIASAYVTASKPSVSRLPSKTSESSSSREDLFLPRTPSNPDIIVDSRTKPAAAGC